MVTKTRLPWMLLGFAVVALCLACMAPLQSWADGDPDTVRVRTDSNGTPADASKDADVPVKVHITYVLDGKQLSASEVAGKSGHLTIRYEFENTSYETVSINGAEERIYTPFTVITAMMFEKESFKNAEGKNIRIIEDGDTLVVAGYAMPGLSESLALEDSESVPDYLEVSADVESFEMKSTLTIVTAGLLNDVDTSKLDFEGLSDAGALTSAMDQLIEGSASLTSGLDQLASGADALAQGAGQLSSSLQTAKAGMPAMVEAVSQMRAASGQITSGASVVHATELKIKETLVQLRDLAKSLLGASSVSGASVGSQSTSEAEAQLGANEAAAQNASSTAQAAASSIGEAQASLASIDTTKLDPETAAAVESARQQLGQARAEADEAQVHAQSVDDSAVREALAVSPQALSDGDRAKIEALVQGLEGLLAAFGSDDDPQSLIGGTNALEQGSASLEGGLGQLEGKASEMAYGFSLVSDGADQLAASSEELAQGAGSAAQGSSQLTQGLGEFNCQGISKIVELIDVKLLGTSERMKAVVQAGNDFDSTGNKKFVFETDAIEKR